MDDRQRRENERNVRSNDFLTANVADFAQNEVAQAKIGALTDKVTRTQQEHQKQIAGSTDVRLDKSLARDAFEELLDAMRDVRDFANSIAQEDRSLENKFRLPRQSGKRELISAARVFADDALDYQQAFIDYGMDADFIADLREKADSLEEALAEAEASTGDRVGAIDTLGQEIKEANKLIDILDPIVRRVYRTDPTKLSAWAYACHIKRYTPKPRPSKITSK